MGPRIREDTRRRGRAVREPPLPGKFVGGEMGPRIREDTRRISVLFQALDSRINVKAAVEAENASYSCLLHDSHV